MFIVYISQETSHTNPRWTPISKSDNKISTWQYWYNLVSKLKYTIESTIFQSFIDATTVSYRDYCHFTLHIPDFLEWTVVSITILKINKQKNGKLW